VGDGEPADNLTAAAAAAVPVPVPVEPAPASPAVADVHALTAAMAAGDPAAVAAFYERYFDRLYGWARRFTRRDESFCLDVVQDAVLRVVRTVRRVDAEPQLLAWLRAVVQTTAYDLLKAERRRARRQAAAAVLGPPSCCGDDGQGPASHPAPAAYDDHALTVDDAHLAWLRAELDSLDPRLAEMIDLRYRGGWTLRRIGAAFGVSAGTVDGRLRRALAALGERARKVFPDG
jgi:RNA polymerase sigma factor (sigma-70 family)